MPDRRNVLFIVVDQMRADILHGALGDAVDLPNLRALMGEGVSFARHHTVCTPCGPSRASLLTGQYAFAHGAVRNGTPLPADTPNLATALRSGGWEPLLFGYTDSAPDPRGRDPKDPDLRSYEGLMPGLHEVLRMRMDSDCAAWEGRLRAAGLPPMSYSELYAPDGKEIDDPAKYPAEISDTAFLTDRVIEDLAARPPGWFALVTYVRPHPPFVAPAPYNRLVDPDAVPGPLPAEVDHPFLATARSSKPASDMVEGFPDLPQDEATVRRIRAIYLGLVAEIDHHLGRLFAMLRETGQYDETLIVFTSDHGEMLGDRGQWGKLACQDAAFHVPLIIRDPAGGPAGALVEAETESVDLAPTILDLLTIDAPDTMTGRSLRPWLAGEAPGDWRDYSFAEVDFGDPVSPTPFQRELGLTSRESSLAILRRGPHRLVQFAAKLPPLLFDHTSGGEGENLAARPEASAILLDLSQRMICHRMVHGGGLFAQTMITEEGVRRGGH